MNRAQTPQRSFVIGDSWLFYKLYTGHKTADQLLTQVIKPFTEEMQQEGLIDKWFFIRYTDPKFHLRVRFSLTNQQALATVIQRFNQKLQPFVNEDLIWKVQMEDYHRELERYGLRGIEEAESLFLHDSQFVVQLLDLIEGQEGEEIRWLSSLCGVDSLLDAFDHSLEEKLALANRLKTGFANEFGSSRFLKKQLDQKYRKLRKRIDYFIGDELEQDHELAPVHQLLKVRQAEFRLIAQKLRSTNPDQLQGKSWDDLMASYIHMFMNRLFRSENRKYEMVIYDFLYRSYLSQRARLKYQQ